LAGIHYNKVALFLKRYLLQFGGFRINKYQRIENMKPMKAMLTVIILAVGCFFVSAQETAPQKESRMQWFEEAKLGIFIHWGIYSVKGIDESWSFYNEYISYQDYMKQLNGFTAAKFDPVCQAVRKRGLKLGIYFSQLDWSSKNYPHFTKTKRRYEPKNDLQRWRKFLNFQRAQLKEICNNFSPDLIWFDGDWDYNAEMWQAREQRQEIFKQLPDVILNSRLNGYGDYATPEQGVPVCKPKDRWWELCMTMNDSWGYQPNDLNYKTPNQIIRIFIDCICMGGNLLLDIGPKADGTIPEQQVRILHELGRWTNKHREAVYGVQPGIKHGHFYGPTALSKSKNILYLYVVHRPHGPIVLKGIKNKINRIWVVGDGTKLKWDIKMKPYWSKVPGLVYIDVPEPVLDQQVTVLAVFLDGKIDLYREYGQVVESN